MKEKLLARVQPSFNYTKGKSTLVTNIIYNNNIAEHNEGSEFCSCFSVESGIKHGVVLPLFLWIVCIEFILRNMVKFMENCDMNRKVELSYI